MIDRLGRQEWKYGVTNIVLDVIPRVKSIIRQNFYRVE